MTNYEAVTSFDVEGGKITALLHETDLSLSAALIAPQSETINLHYKITEADKDFSYPLAAFVPRITRFTLAADELAKGIGKRLLASAIDYCRNANAG